MKHLSMSSPVIFSLNAESLMASLCNTINGETSYYNKRDFADGESYLCIKTDVHQHHCIVVADMSHPNNKFLPLLFLKTIICCIDALHSARIKNIKCAAQRYMVFLQTALIKITRCRIICIDHQ